MRKQFADLENFAYQIMDVKKLEQQEKCFFWDLNKRVGFSKFSKFEKQKSKLLREMVLNWVRYENPTKRFKRMKFFYHLHVFKN